VRHARQQTRLTTMPDRVPPVRSFASGRERLTSSVYKVDKFAVPAASIDAFVAKLTETHAFLDDMEGCIQNLILTQESGPGGYNIVTIVEWRDQACLDRARSLAAERYRESGFEPATMIDALGIRADLGNYRVVEH